MVTADRIAVMRAGEIVQVGPPAEVYEAPNSRYVADFIGEVNLFEGVVTLAAGGLLRVGTTDAALGLEAAADGGPPVGSTAWLAVRPEKMALHLAAPPEGPNRLAGKVTDVGYLGDWTTYRVTLESGRVVRAAQANAARRIERPLDPGDPVWLSFAPDAAVVLTQ